MNRRGFFGMFTQAVAAAVVGLAGIAQQVTIPCEKRTIRWARFKPTSWYDHVLEDAVKAGAFIYDSGVAWHFDYEGRRVVNVTGKFFCSADTKAETISLALEAMLLRHTNMNGMRQEARTRVLHALGLQSYMCVFKNTFREFPAAVEG